MGIAWDGLRNLLDALVESVERGGTGEEISARVHVSRFHFDRIVAAALTETPGAFRRRLHPRASGVRARRRRERGGGGARRRLPLAGGIRTCVPEEPRCRSELVRRQFVAGGERSTMMDLTDRLLEHDLWLTGRLLAAAEVLPEDALAESLDVEGETLGSMLERLVWSKEMWIAAVEGRPLPERRAGSPECPQRRLGEAGPAFVDIVRDARSRGAWDTAFVDATCEPPESFTYGGMAAHVLTWSAFRRNVVIEALQRHGVAVEHADPLGWESAERA